MTTSTVRAQMLNDQIKASIDVYNSVMDGITPELAHTQPNGTANSIAATIGHLLTSVDGVINGLIRQSAPVFAMQPTGLSDMPPGGADQFNWYDWGTQVSVDLDVARQYGEAVFASVDAYLSSIDDSALDAPLQTPSGPRSTLEIINLVVLNGLNQHAGEISALKGIYASLKGFPF